MSKLFLIVLLKICVVLLLGWIGTEEVGDGMRTIRKDSLFLLFSALHAHTRLCAGTLSLSICSSLPALSLSPFTETQF